MTRPDVRNELLRSFRVRLFDTQQAMADAANEHLAPAYLLTANDIGKFERGVVDRPSAPRRAALRTVCGVATDAEIGLVRRGRSVEENGQGRSAEPPLGMEAAGEVSPPFAVPSTKSSDPLGAHDLLRFTSVLSRSAISDSDLTAVELASESLDRQYAQLGPNEVLVRVSTLMNGVLSQLAEHQTLLKQQRLVTLVARLGGLRAWACFDIDEHRAADRWFELAVSAAQEARAWSVGAWLSGAQSLIPWHQRDFRAAITLIERGIYLAGHGTDATTKAWLFALQCRGRAALRDADGFDASYALAQETAEYSNERDRRHGMDFDQGLLDLRYYAGTGRLLLHQPAKAQVELSASLQALPPRHNKARAVLTLSLADAATQSSDVIQAVALTHTALASTMHQPILPILQQARRVHRLVQRHDPQAGQALESPIRDFTASLATLSPGAPS